MPFTLQLRHKVSARSRILAQLKRGRTVRKVWRGRHGEARLGKARHGVAWQGLGGTGTMEVSGELGFKLDDSRLQGNSGVTVSDREAADVHFCTTLNSNNTGKSNHG